jgi:hypothetical protein
MAERDPYPTELDLCAAFSAFLEDAPTDVRPRELARHFATTYPHRRTALGPWHLPAIPRLAWALLMLAALLAATVSAVFVGSVLLRQRNELSDVPRPPAVPAPSRAPIPSAAPTGEPAIAADMSADQFREIAFAADGSAWAATRLGVVHWDLVDGSATVYDQRDGLPERDVDHVSLAPDGTVWASGDAWVARFDGTWTAYTGFDEIVALALGADGTVWASDRRELQRYDGAWTAIALPEAVSDILGLWVAPDGSVWMNGSTWPDGGSDPRRSAIVVFDGRSWTVHSKESTGLPREPHLAGLTPDGSAWVHLWAEGCEYTATAGVACDTPSVGVARFDGARWTVYTNADVLAADDQADAIDDPGLEIGPDGTVWATYGATGIVSRFDGSRWISDRVPELSGSRLFAFGPDGTPWFGAADGLLRYDGSAVTRVPSERPTVRIERDVAPLGAPVIGGPTVTESALGTITLRVHRATSASSYGLRATSSAHGPVVIEEGDLRWLTADGSWAGTSLPIEASRVQALADDVVAYGGTAAVRLSWDGARWAPTDHLDLPAPLDTVSGFATGARGTVAVGWEGALGSSTDGVHFAMAARPPDGITDTVLATRDGFVALVPSRDGGGLREALTWSSGDGSTWELAAAASPFGAGSVVTSIASRDGRHVAVGPSGVWVSDDGLTWEQVAPSSDIDAATVAAGPAGWLATGLDGSAWTSADGRAWEELRGWPGLTEHGGFDVPQAIAFGPGVVVVRGRLPTPESPPGVEAFAVGTLEP